jgi:short-subunit dehydrogenase
MSNILICGATSAIAQAFARRYASKDSKFFLLARDKNKLDIIKNDLLARGAATVDFDIINMEHRHDWDKIIQNASQRLGGFDIALIAHGVLPEQKSIKRNPGLLHQTFEINSLSSMGICEALAHHMEDNKTSATIAIISSVAGDRGRQSNYIYGASKAALDTYIQGLRNRLYQHKIHVLNIKPGFVDTPMTENFKKGGLLWSTPDKVASDIDKAIHKRKFIVYTPFFWRPIMFIIRNIPETIFQRLSL